VSDPSAAASQRFQAITPGEQAQPLGASLPFDKLLFARSDLCPVALRCSLPTLRQSYAVVLPTFACRAVHPGPSWARCRSLQRGDHAKDPLQRGDGSPLWISAGQPRLAVSTSGLLTDKVPLRHGPVGPASPAVARASVVRQVPPSACSHWDAGTGVFQSLSQQWFSSPAPPVLSAGWSCG
jgi:hypothetical protein